jgi:hypothetical protein
LSRGHATSISGQSSGFHQRNRHENTMESRENGIGTLAARHHPGTEAQRFGGEESVA